MESPTPHAFFWKIQLNWIDVDSRFSHVFLAAVKALQRPVGTTY